MANGEDAALLALTPVPSAVAIAERSAPPKGGVQVDVLGARPQISSDLAAFE